MLFYLKFEANEPVLSMNYKVNEAQLFRLVIYRMHAIEASVLTEPIIVILWVEPFFVSGSHIIA